MPNVLQSVRPDWKVDLAIDVTIHIDQTQCEVFAVGVVPFRERGEGTGFVTAIMINRCVRVLRDLVQKLPPHVGSWPLLVIYHSGISWHPVCFYRIYLHTHKRQS